MKNRLILVCSLLLLACAEFRPSKTKTTPSPIGLSEIRQLIIQKTTVEDARKILGSPERILSIPEKPEVTIWAYLRDGFESIPRLSLEIDKSGIVTQINWFIRDYDPELDLKKAMALFPHSHFEVLPEEWIGHSAPEDRVYEDSQIGVEIFYRKARKEVHAIVWIPPKENK